MLKLYYSPGACSLAPHIVLAEIGQPYETVLVSTMDGSTGTAEYLKINPKGRVPVLDTDSERFTEASAIMLYLALTHPEAELVTETPTGIARAVEWMNFLSGIHASIIAQNWRTERFSENAASHKEIQTKGMKNLYESYSLIDTKLKDKTWATGEDYSIVDPYLLVFFRWGNRLGLDMAQFNNWRTQTAKLEKRSAVQAVLEYENIFIWE